MAKNLWHKRITVLTKLTNLELSIQLSLSGLSFCILNRDTNTITALQSHQFNKKVNPLELLKKLQHIFNSESHLQNTFGKVIVIHENELATLVPKPMFNAQCLTDYLKFNAKILKTDYISHDTIVANNCINVYIPYININNFIYDTYGNFTFKHISTVLIEEILDIEKNSKAPKVYVNVGEFNFEILVVNDAKLLFYNSFEYNTKEDFIYYLLFTAEQLKLNPETLNLIFIGDIDSKDDLYVIAYKYIRFVFLGNREDNFKYANEAQPRTNHSNFPLIKSF